MIVRIMGEGQWRLADDVRERVNELDNACVAAVDAGDEAGFHEHFDGLVAMIRADGDHLADDELEGSDIIVPPSDTSFEEAKGEFSGEGLIPD